MRLLGPILVAAAVVVLSCSNPTGACGCSPPLSLRDGTWTATEFKVTPAGQSQLDVLASGGSLTIVIAPNFSTSGNLVIPAALNGGTLFTASMAGTVTFNFTTGLTTFQQTADSFVRDLTWDFVNGDSKLGVSNQTAGSASYTITLTRQ